jgi:hypothetical protein
MDRLKGLDRDAVVNITRAGSDRPGKVTLIFQWSHHGLACPNIPDTDGLVLGTRDNTAAVI